MPLELSRDYIQNSGFSPEEQLKLWRMAQEDAERDEGVNQSQYRTDRNRIIGDTVLNAALFAVPAAPRGIIAAGRGLASLGGRALNFGRGLFGRTMPTAGRTMAQATRNASALESGAAAGAKLMKDPLVRTGVGAARAAGRGVRAAGRAAGRAPVSTALALGGIGASVGPKLVDGVGELFDEGEEVTPEMIQLAQQEGNELNLAPGLTPEDVIYQDPPRKLVSPEPMVRDPNDPMADLTGPAPVSAPGMTPDQELVQALMQSQEGPSAQVARRRPLLGRAFDSFINGLDRGTAAALGRPSPEERETNLALQRDQLRRSRQTLDPSKEALLRYALEQMGADRQMGRAGSLDQNQQLLRYLIENQLLSSNQGFQSGQNELDRSNRLDVARMANPFAGMTVEELMALSRQGAGQPTEPVIRRRE